MLSRNNKLSIIDNIMKDSLFYFRKNYIQLFFMVIFTVIVLKLFYYTKGVLLDYYKEVIFISYSPMHIYYKYALQIFFGFSSFLIFPIVLLVTRNIVLGAPLSLGEFINQPKSRIIHVLLALAKLYLPLFLVNYVMNSGLKLFANKLSNHLMNMDASGSIVMDEFNEDRYLPFWVYEHAGEIASYIFPTEVALGQILFALTWYIAARWSMMIVSAALDKTFTFKQSATFTKGYVGVVFFSIILVSVIFRLLEYTWFQALVAFTTGEDIFSTQTNTLTLWGYFLDYVTLFLVVLKWTMYTILLSKTYVVIESKMEA